MSEEIKTLRSAYEILKDKHEECDTLRDFPQISGDAVQKTIEAMEEYASQFKSSAPDTEVEKLDFKALGKLKWKQKYSDLDPSIWADEIEGYAVAYRDGQEDAWNDHVLPLHSFLKTKEARILELEEKLEAYKLMLITP